MSQTFYTLLTNVGLAKITNAQITQSAVEITHLAVGDGNGAYYEPTQAATALRNERWRGRVAKVEQAADNPNWIVIEISVPANAGGWTIREIGIFDAAGDLIAIGKHPETYKPLLTSGSAKDLLIQMVIEVSNANSVELKIDPNIIVASRNYVDDEISKVENPGFAATAELARGLRALALEQERFNKQTLMQGTATITGEAGNGYFRNAEAFTSIAFSGFGQPNTPNYQVLLTPIAGDVNLIGELIAYDKTRNGFKVRMTGSAQSVTFVWAIVNKLA